MDTNKGVHFNLDFLDSILEQNAIRYKLMPSLVHLASVKGASCFWVGKLARERASEVVGHYDRGVVRYHYNNLSRKLGKEVQKLPLPSALIALLTFYVERLGAEVLEWVIHQSSIGSFIDPWKYFHHIRWTGWGRVNARETARSIVSQGKINHIHKKRASKFYCLESSKKSLLKQVVANWDYIKCIPIFGEFQYGTCHVEDHPNSHALLADFDYILVKKKSGKIKTVRGPSFYKLAKCCDTDVLTALWASFSQETKSQILTKGQFECKSVVFLCFLLSQMDYGQQTNFIQVHSRHVLISIYKDWFFKDYFLPTSLHFLHALDFVGFSKLLVGLTQVVQSSLPDIWFKKLFVEFLQRLPDDFKARMGAHPEVIYVKSYLISLLEVRNPDMIERLDWFLAKKR